MPEFTRIEESPTYTVDIFIAGDHEQAKQAAREFCLEHGWCVTVTPTAFIYTGGEESGVRVGAVNYPRFPCTPDELFAKARQLAESLVERLCQHSVLLVAPDRSVWLTRRRLAEAEGR